MKLLTVALEQIFYVQTTTAFTNKMYTLAMCSSLSPLLSEMFIDKLEKSIEYINIILDGNVSTNFDPIF